MLDSLHLVTPPGHLTQQHNRMELIQTKGDHSSILASRYGSVAGLCELTQRMCGCTCRSRGIVSEGMCEKGQNISYALYRINSHNCSTRLLENIELHNFKAIYFFSGSILLQEALPGMTDLVPNSPVLREEWRHVEAALQGHQRKVQQALKEKQALLSNPTHLPGAELTQADEAVQRLLKELEEQRKTFVHYINRIIQVCQTCCHVNDSIMWTNSWLDNYEAMPSRTVTHSCC